MIVLYGFKILRINAAVAVAHGWDIYTEHILFIFWQHFYRNGGFKYFPRLKVNDAVFVYTTVAPGEYSGLR